MSSSINLKLGARKATAAGKPDASAIEMERRIIWIRWLAILVSLGALPFLASSLNRQSLVTLLALIGLGAIYNLTLLVVLLPRKPEWLTAGYISAIGDVLLVTGGVAVTGGLESPFFLAYFVVTVTTAVRFGGLAPIVAVLTIALSYAAADRPGRVDAPCLDALRRLDARAEGAPCRGRPDDGPVGADAGHRRAGHRRRRPESPFAQRAQAPAGRHVVPDPGLPRRPRDRRHDRRLHGPRATAAPDRAGTDADFRRARRHRDAQRPRPRPGAEALRHGLGDRAAEPPLLPYEVR